MSTPPRLPGRHSSSSFSYAMPMHGVAETAGAAVWISGQLMFYIARRPRVVSTKESRWYLAPPPLPRETALEFREKLKKEHRSGRTKWHLDEFSRSVMPELAESNNGKLSYSTATGTASTYMYVRGAYDVYCAQKKTPTFVFLHNS